MYKIGKWKLRQKKYVDHHPIYGESEDVTTADEWVPPKEPPKILPLCWIHLSVEGTLMPGRLEFKVFDDMPITS